MTRPDYCPVAQEPCQAMCVLSGVRCEIRDGKPAQQPQAAKPLEPLEPATSYVQPVPDHCDRIVWRSNYYHLPLKQPQAEPVYQDMRAMANAVWAEAQSKEPQAEAVPAGYRLVMVPDAAPSDEPDWDECIRQAEAATGIKVERHTISIVIREVRRWLAHRQADKKAPQQAEATDSMGIPLSCGKPLCSPGDHHPLCKLHKKPQAEAVPSEAAIKTAWKRVTLEPCTHFEAFRRGALWATPQQAEAVPSDVARDAERYRWLRENARATSEHWGGRWSLVVEGQAPGGNAPPASIDEAVDAAIAQQKGQP